jgi:hypothetical protein
MGISLKEYKSICNRCTCTPIFIAAIFILAKIWKQPRYPSSDEWINNIYVCTLEHYLTIKTNDIISLARKCMDLVIIMVSDINQNEMTSISCFLSYVEPSL